MKKEKPCKLCKTKRFANTSYCYKHYKELEKKKKIEKLEKAKIKKESTKKFQESERKKLHGKAWKLISEIVRRDGVNLDGYGECYTCGNIIHWKEANAGHFKHDRLDFDFRNLKRQCIKCNQHYSGRLDIYAEKLINENGLEWFNQLCRDANDYNKYDSTRLKEIIKELEIKLLEIKNGTSV